MRFEFGGLSSDSLIYRSLKFLKFYGVIEARIKLFLECFAQRELL